MSSVAWEPILVTLWNITTQCAWYLLLHQLYTATISPCVSDLNICHIIVSCYGWYPATVPFDRSVTSVSTLAHVPHLLTSMPQGDKCCHHVLCVQEYDHCRDFFMPSHFEPSYQYPVKTILNTLYTAHNLGKIFRCIQLLVHHTLISSSTCHEILLTALLKYNNCSLASNMQDILTFAPVFNEPEACRTHSMFTQNKYCHTTTLHSKILDQRPHVTVDQSIHLLSIV